MISNYDVRFKARAVLGGQLFAGPWLYPMLIMLLASLITGAISFTYVGPLLILGLISVGLAHYYSGILRRTVQYDNITEVINGAKEDVTGNMLTGVLVSVFTFLWSLLFIIPGIVKSCSYALAFYIKNDHPEMSATEAIRESQRMMNGYKWQYFCLQFSFIGWYIVGAFCLGIGTYWVNAYNEMANAIFYEEIKALQYTSTPIDINAVLATDNTAASTNDVAADSENKEPENNDDN